MSIDAKRAAVIEVQHAAEAAMQNAVTYITTDPNPTAEGAHLIIENTLAGYNCESPEGRIVASGVATAEPHEVGSGPIETGVPIVIDIYPRSKNTGYWADITRTICLGTAPQELLHIYDAVKQAQEIAITLIKPGVSARDIHQAASDHFTQLGYVTSGVGDEFPFAEGFVHSLGHGVGKAIHDQPKISAKSEDILKVGDIITIEPGLYYKHLGGVRLEDLLVVTETGAENLTRFPHTFVYKN